MYQVLRYCNQPKRQLYSIIKVYSNNVFYLKDFNWWKNKGYVGNGIKTTQNHQIVWLQIKKSLSRVFTRFLASHVMSWHDFSLLEVGNYVCMHMYEYAFYVLRYTCTYVSLIYRRIYWLQVYIIHTLNWQISQL